MMRVDEIILIEELECSLAYRSVRRVVWCAKIPGTEYVIVICIWSRSRCFSSPARLRMYCSL